jgi:hypothetical protein
MEEESAWNKLQTALRTRRLIRFSRRFEQPQIRGCVLDVGPRFFLLALVTDRIWFDGFDCLRLVDASNIENDKYAEFTKAALTKRGESIPPKPNVDLTDLEALLQTASDSFPLVAIHREEIRSDVCHIGRVVGIGQGRVSLLEIGPDAKWDSDPTEYHLDEITRVNFGGDYEGALHLVGGEPPNG